MIEIDGAAGEGGGQILRTALSLAVARQQAVRVVNVRANRQPPGLRAQHLTSIHAAQMISRAKVLGAEPGSTRLEFTPGAVQAGEYRLSVGTAGSTSLVLQTITLPLALASGSSRVIITGGTHNDRAPCYEYLVHVWARWMAGMGISISIQLERAGFFPRGGGQITATISGLGGPQKLGGMEVTQRGPLTATIAISAVGNVPVKVARRQVRGAQELLAAAGLQAEFKCDRWPARDPGGVCFLGLEFASSVAGFFSLAGKNKPREAVGREAAQQVVDFLQAEQGGAVDPYAADQIMLPLALAAGASRYSTPRLTQHTLTNAGVIAKMTDRQIQVSGQLGRAGRVEID